MVTSTTTGTGPADDLGELLTEARNIDAGNRPTVAPPSPGQVAAAELDAATTEAREVVELVASLALPLVAWKWGAEAAQVYGKAEREAIAQALGKVAHKRGWSIAGTMESFGPELGLAAALVGPALPLLLGKMQAAREAAAPAPAPAPAPAEAGELDIDPDDPAP